jgi:hypothetical protein
MVLWVWFAKSLLPFTALDGAGRMRVVVRGEGALARGAALLKEIFQCDLIDMDNPQPAAARAPL